MTFQSFELVVPIPPTLNKAYPTNFVQKRRHSSKVVIEYKKIIRSLLLAKKYNTFMSSIELWLHFTFPDNRRRDLSNHIKVLEDCLVANKVIQDDYLVDLLIVSRLKPSKNNPHVQVIVYGEY